MIDRVLRDKLVDAYMMTIPLITLNVVWFIASIPLVTAIPAAAALFYATNQVAHGKPANVSTFVEGFRLCFRRSWTWGLMNLLVAAAMVAYLYIFARNGEDWGTWASAFVLVFAFIWLSVQLYTFPLLLEQEQPRLRLALQNSLILLLKRPFYTLGVTALLVLLVVASTLLIFPAWMLLTGGVCAYFANLATLNSIERVTGKRRVAAPAEDPVS